MPKQSVLITGCSEGGIGYALAREFQSRGLHVFATARDPAKMAGLENLPDVTLLALDANKWEAYIPRQQFWQPISRSHLGY
jgi:1-acylglycerone phosphate reductase